MSRDSSAGRRPTSARRAKSRAQRPAARDRRSTAPLPKRLSPRAAPISRRQTTLTGRAAILAVAIASVIVAIAVPFKLWLGQRGDIRSLTSQSRTAQQQIRQLNAQDKRWNDPAYVEAQAKQRLHYVVPGQKTYIVLGRTHKPHAAAPQPSVVSSTGPWYSELWQSMQTAGGTSASSK